MYKRINFAFSSVSLPMDSVLKSNIQVRLINFFTTRVVYHTTFWLVILFLLTINEMVENNETFFFALGNNFIRMAIFAIIVYINLFYLIPQYLTQKKFLTYFGFLIVTVLIITPLESILFYFKFSDLTETQNAVLRDLNWSFIPNFLFGGASTIFKIITDWLRHLREKQELQTQTMQSELRFLKSQINPHFLFNTLNNLYALTLKKSDKAPEIVIKLSEMMRYMLYECNEKQVYLSKEVNYLRNYLDLERLRQGKNVEIGFEVRGSISNQKIVPLLLITFLENSFKHGLNMHLSQGFVKILLEVNDNYLDFFIENSKPERMPKPTHRRSGGIGLVNVRRRLDLLYPERYDLEIEENPNTYAVNLKLELD